CCAPRRPRPQHMHRRSIDRLARRVIRNTMHIMSAFDEPADPRPRMHAVEITQHGDPQPFRCRHPLDAIAHPRVDCTTSASIDVRPETFEATLRSASTYSRASRARGTTASSAGCPEIIRYATNAAAKCATYV